MEKQISIIIPTYNMEAYIGKCLDSLIIPEFDAVEVLVVNDGSKDRSSEIAHSYADRYPASIRVIDKPNGNYGSCINAALPLATGRYVKILDADDTFDTDAFSRLLRLLPTISEDAIITSYVKVDDNGEEILNVTIRDWDVPYNCPLNIDDVWNVIGSRYIQMHMIAYKRSLFSSFEYHQTEGISYTDTEWAIVPLCNCSSLRFIDLCVYRYLTGRDGQTMAPVEVQKKYNNLITILESLYSSFISSEKANVKARMRDKVVDRHCGIYNIGIGLHSSDIMRQIREYDEKLSKFAPEIYDGIGAKRYVADLPFCYFRYMREKGYPVKINLPLLFRIQLFIKSHLHLSK